MARRLCSSAIPCTGGSQWQVVDIAKNGITTKLEEHWTLFRRLWKAFKRVAAPVISSGGLVCNEWPLRCAYWRQKAVTPVIKTFQGPGARLHV